MEILNKDSDIARLASKRIRIVRETNPREPCDNEDLVFEKAESKDSIPENALYSWKFQPYGHDCIWFFTTAERCKEMVSNDPSYWTEEKLKKFAEIEHKLYEDWYNGRVYGYVVEEWDNAQRMWKKLGSTFGMYGKKDLIDNLNDIMHDTVEELVVCADSQDILDEIMSDEC